MCIQADYSLLESAAKWATILIAMANIFLAYKVFKIKDKKDDDQKERERKLQWLKTLVIDHTLIHLYDFFDKIDKELIPLKNNNLTDDEKGRVDGNLGDHFIFIRRKFVDVLLAIDKNLYSQVLDSLDKLQEHLAYSIFDSGINLSHLPKYNETINEKLTNVQTEIIRILFSYKGN